MTLISQLIEFFQRYFINPMQNYSGYNIVNTLVYGIILGIAVLFIFRLLKKLGVEIDEDFGKTLTPYIIIGTTTRALVDAGLYPRTYWSISPGIWITVGLSTLLLLLIFRKIFKNNWKKPFQLLGYALVIVNVFFIIREGINPIVIIQIMFFFLLVYSLIYAFPKININDSHYYLNKLSTAIEANLLLFAAHIFDASTTFVGVDFHGYWEQHVLAGFLIDLLGTGAAMYPLKLSFLIPVVLILEELNNKEEVDTNLINLVKLAIFILGIGPGTRNLLRTAMGV